MEEVKETQEIQQPVQPVETQEEVKVNLYDQVLKDKPTLDKINDYNRKSLYAKILGKNIDEITGDDLKLKLTVANKVYETKTDYETKIQETQNKYLKKLAEKEVKSQLGEHYEAFGDRIDYSKISEDENGELIGLTEQIEVLKEKFGKYMNFEVVPKGKIKEVSPIPTQTKTKEQLEREKGEKKENKKGKKKQN